MSLIRPDGVIVQFDAEDLIVKLKEDIKQYGFGKRVRAWCINTEGVVIYINYNYLDEEPVLRDIEKEHGVYFKIMAMGELLPLLEKENSILY